MVPITGSESGNVECLEWLYWSVERSAVDEAHKKAEFAREEHKKNLRKSYDTSGSTNELKKLRLNKQSAAASRVRRETFSKELEKSVILLEKQNIVLRQNVIMLRQERDQLQKQIEILHELVEILKLGIDSDSQN
eukprot:CAMPEP_0182443256 /NCGR_PEP_ID=MMETSP1172-20130603/2027_1 /TAXON_ID=708627 /ORGANISM="Timspurckia oligopyrenoides, Strain CCMP3278" /LENGTH=134 /DNA_ID=CAMNT_0024638459 /DNA_START=142 /DNA_END=546 /DNA_ORIENTATION=-